GWSLGANVLLKYMAEEGDRALVSVAAAICAPFRLMACAKRLREGFSRQYQDSLLKDLRAMLRRKHAVVPVPDGVNLEGALRARDFIEFDDAYTAPLHGFRDAADYYARCESAQFLKLIRRPTLIVNAADDPFMGPDILPKARQLAPSVTLEVARSGGHVGFVAAGRFGQPVYWLEQHLAQYLVSSIAETHSSHESLVSAEVPG
ncbi:MAG: YheT family hydrolase, partial [Stenotrophobium sp.]